MNSVKCTVYSAQEYSVQCTVYSAQYTVHKISVYSVQCTVHSIQCTVHITVYSTGTGGKWPITAGELMCPLTTALLQTLLLLSNYTTDISRAVGYVYKD